MPKTYNKTGRSKGHERYIELPNYLFDCFAWSCLSPVSQAVWLRLMREYRGPGSNNGKIVMSSRMLGEKLDCGKSTAERALKQLITYGFVEIAKGSSFSQKRMAAEYRMTHLPCDITGALPSKAFMRLTDTQLKPKSKGNGKGTASYRFMCEPDRFI